jgi:hypothetical protein
MFIASNRLLIPHAMFSMAFIELAWEVSILSIQIVAWVAWFAISVQQAILC